MKRVIRSMFMSLTVCENRLDSSRLSRTSLMRLIRPTNVNVAARVLYSEVSDPMNRVVIRSMGPGPMLSKE